MNKKNCSVCLEDKRLVEFYTSYSPLDTDGKVRACKKCLNSRVVKGDLKSFQDVLRSVDKPFIIHLYESAITKNAVLGEYFKLINAKDFRHLNWDNSVFEHAKEVPIETPEYVQEAIEDVEFLDKLKELYGFGYPDEQYILFEKRYQNLKTSFQLPTPMHEEYLREYCVNKVKESLAKAKGDFKEAKEWAAMAKDASSAGKLQPSQMSKSDLTQGLDGFGQLSRMVEENQDIIELLPKFVKQPKDDVDVTLWLYINYIRDLEGLPPAEYQDIYAFYEERAKDYNIQKLDGESNG